MQPKPPDPPKPGYETKLFTCDVNLPYNETYAPVAQKVDSVGICTFFGVTTTQFKTLLKEAVKLKYYAVKADTTIDNTPPTGEGNGHWFDGSGNVCTWNSGNGKIYSNYQDAEFYTNIGQYPKKTVVGDKFTVRQGFVYAPDALTTYLAVLVFNITITTP
jgi:hypothetical protein